MAKAHQLDAKRRTQDIVQPDSESPAASFADLLLSEPVLAGLAHAGYRTPSPIQLKAIPLGRCGLDLVVQSKAGTGKTCVFAVLALESLLPDFASAAAPVGVRVLALSPTREVALQSRRAIEAIGQRIAGLRCGLFIGGLGAGVKEASAEAAACQVAVGTPGRVRQLIESGCLRTDRVRMLVLDEADALMDDSFQQDINWIYWSLPQSKQVLALSATYPDSMAQQLSLYMRDPTLVRLSGGQLLGVRLYWRSVPDSHLPNLLLDRKAKVLGDLLANVQFGQCLVFSNYQERARELCQRLESAGWPVAYLAGRLQQVERIGAYDRLRDFRCRVLVATDVAARGVDAENVDLVVNLDLPRDHRTLLHRIGRAGRYGSYAAAVSLVGDGVELRQLRDFERLAGLRMSPLPDPPPSDLASGASAGCDDAAVAGAATFIEIESLDDAENDGGAPVERSVFEPDPVRRPPAQRKQQHCKGNRRKQHQQRHRRERLDDINDVGNDNPNDEDDWATFEASAATANQGEEDSEVLRLRALLHGGGSQPETAAPTLPPPTQTQSPPITEESKALASALSSSDNSHRANVDADFLWIGQESDRLAALLADRLANKAASSCPAATPADTLEARDIILIVAASKTKPCSDQLNSLLPNLSLGSARLPQDQLLELADRINGLARFTELSSAPAGLTFAPAGLISAPAGLSSAPAGLSSAPAGPTSAPAEPTSAPARHTSALAEPTSAPAGPTSVPAMAVVSGATDSASRPLNAIERQMLRELLAADAELAQLRRLINWHRRGCQRELALMRQLRRQLEAG